MVSDDDRRSIAHGRLVARREWLGRLARVASLVAILPLLCSELVRDAFGLGRGPLVELLFWVPALVGLAGLLTVFVVATRIDAVLWRGEAGGTEGGGGFSTR